MTVKKSILIVEDEIKIAQLLVDFLQADNFNTHVLHDGADVIDCVRSNHFDFILLDVMLPNVDGLTLCKEIRQFSNVPILMLTARVDEIDRLMGLGFGADDYVCKPFSAREVVARVQGILKRVGNFASDNPHDIKQYKNIYVNKQKLECLVQGKLVELTQVEFKLLFTLMSKPGNVCHRDMLMSHSYDDGRIVSHRTIDSHIKNLRNKITAIDATNNLIHSIYGVGYKIE